MDSFLKHDLNIYDSHFMKQLLDGCCMPFFLLNTLQKGRIIFVGHPFVGACDERGGWQHKLKLVQDNRVFYVPLVIQPHPTLQWGKHPLIDDFPVQQEISYCHVGLLQPISYVVISVLRIGSR